MEMHLFNLGPPPTEEAAPVVVRPNVWLLSSEELPPLLFTAEECARLLGVGRPKIFRLIGSGDLRSVKVGNSRRVSARALSEYVAGLEQEALT